MATNHRWKAREPREAQFARQLSEAREGCGDALGELLQGCRRYLLLAANRALESTLRPKEGASDLVQKSFIIAHRDFRSFEGKSLGELLAWLHLILERQLLLQVRYYKTTHKRSVRREVALDAQSHDIQLALADPGAAPGTNCELADERRRVQAAIERLPDDCRRVLWLRTWQRLPFAQVAEQLGRSTGAAEKLWLRAVERLQAELKVLR